MKKLWISWLRRLERYLAPRTAPHPDELVTSLILHTASLELAKGEFIELAPIKGCCGPFKLSGNCLPVFEYIVFDKTAPMEFIKVRVEISKPDRIEFSAAIESIHTSDPKRHGEILEVKQRFKEPFEKLALHLFHYFPYHRKTMIQKEAA